MKLTNIMQLLILCGTCLMVGIYIGELRNAVAISFHETVKDSIKVCESDLPRSQHCEAIIATQVKATSYLI